MCGWSQRHPPPKLLVMNRSTPTSLHICYSLSEQWIFALSVDKDRSEGPILAVDIHARQDLRIDKVIEHLHNSLLDMLVQALRIPPRLRSFSTSLVFYHSLLGFCTVLVVHFISSAMS